MKITELLIPPRMQWISLKKPEQVFSEVVEPAKSSGFEVSALQEYGGGSVYKLKKESGVAYVNLVPTNTSIGTIIVVWNRDPNIPAQ